MSLQLLIATTNPAKKKDLYQGLKKEGLNQIFLLFPNQLGIKKQPEEIGKTTKDNAEIKAKFYAQLTNLPTLSDDGAFTIPVLNNQPGVKSRRWLGYEASDEELINYTLKRMAKISQEKRTTYLETSLCFYNPLTKEKFFSHQKIKGYVAEKPNKNRIEGYPYRALFIVEKYNKYYDQLSEKEHLEINHRLKAIKQIAPQIKKSLLK